MRKRSEVTDAARSKNADVFEDLRRTGHLPDRYTTKQLVKWRRIVIIVDNSTFWPKEVWLHVPCETCSFLQKDLIFVLVDGTEPICVCSYVRGVRRPAQYMCPERLQPLC